MNPTDDLEIYNIQKKERRRFAGSDLRLFGEIFEALRMKNLKRIRGVGKKGFI